mgnify:FL=1
MKPSLLYDTLKEIEQGAVSCLDPGTFCSMVWPGCDPPTTCDLGLSVAVFGEIVNQSSACSITTFFDVTIQVSICNPDSANYADSTVDSEDFYTKLLGVYGGLLVWWNGREDKCKMVKSDGFRCGGSNGSTCSRYFSTWRIQVD